MRLGEKNISHLQTPNIQGDDFFDLLESQKILNNQRFKDDLHKLKQQIVRDSTISWTQKKQKKFLIKLQTLKQTKDFYNELKKEVERETGEKIGETSSETTQNSSLLFPVVPDWYSDSADFHKKFTGGEFSSKERIKRKEVKTIKEIKKVTKTTGKGKKKHTETRDVVINEKITLFRDVGVTFYKVKKGDTIYGIRKKLSTNYPKEFGYLDSKNGTHQKLELFNIPANKLSSGLLIPIPWEQEDRKISDKQFLNYSKKALDDLKDNNVYGKHINELLEYISESELLALMIAVAKQESGGKPLGQFEFHRWEPHKNSFSFSIYHILMSGPGLKARRRLHLTEGQLYHPENASKIFLAFMIEKLLETGKNSEKRKENIDTIFQFAKNGDFENFASFYNGKNFYKKNPQYVSNISKYYDEGYNLLDSREGGYGLKEVRIKLGELGFKKIFK